MLTNLVHEIVSKKKSISNANADEIVKFAATLAAQKDKAPDEAPQEPAPTDKTPEEQPKEVETDTLSPAEEPKDPVKPVEADHDWKKRYSDLKRHVDTDLKKQLEEERKARAEAEKALKEGSTKYVKPETLSKFEEEYGDLAPVVKELAFKEADKLFQEYLDRENAKKEAENAEKARKTEYLTEAQRLVAAKHPDFEEIGRSKVFQTWLAEQLDVTKRLAADSDPQSVILVLDMYKKDTGYAAKKAAESKKAKTEAVKVPEETVTPQAPEILDVEKLKKEITKAQSTGDMKKLGELLAKFDKLNRKGK